MKAFKPALASLSLTLLGAASLAAQAVENPFASQELSSGYALAAADKAGEGSCGEGKCGGSSSREKKAEGSCGSDVAEGSCGAKADKKSMEGSCGADKDQKEGSCGNDMKH